MQLMQVTECDLDSFCTWLCQREHETVGRPGMVYHCPLAQWLSERSGHIYGVEGRVYGRATCAYHCWRLLPRWAEVFVAWSDVLAFRPVTGGEALVVLASVELALHVVSADTISPGKERRRYDDLEDRHAHITRSCCD